LSPRFLISNGFFPIFGQIPSFYNYFEVFSTVSTLAK
jgi:hypothetical protein